MICVSVKCKGIQNVCIVMCETSLDGSKIMIITAATHFKSEKVIAKLIGLHILDDFANNSDQ